MNLVDGHDSTVNQTNLTNKIDPSHLKSKTKKKDKFVQAHENYVWTEKKPNKFAIANI